MHYSRENEKVKTARYEGTREISGESGVAFPNNRVICLRNRVGPHVLTGEERSPTVRAIPYNHGVTDRIPGICLIYVEISGFQRNRLAAPLN